MHYRDGGLGVANYHIPTKYEPFNVQVPTWYKDKGKRPNFIEEHVKSRKHVPNLYYNTMGNLCHPKQTDRKYFGSSPRSLLSDEIIAYEKKNRFPGPGNHQPSFKEVEPHIKGALKQSEDRIETSFLGDSMYMGAVSPAYRSLSYKDVDPKIRGPLDYKSAKLGPPGPLDAKLPRYMAGFKPATAQISPSSYDPLSSFRKTQTFDKMAGWGGRKSARDKFGAIDLALSTQKAKVAPNKYDPASIDKGLKATTLGFSRGWK